MGHDRVVLRRRREFTLVELIVVLAILGVLVALLLQAVQAQLAEGVEHGAAQRLGHVPPAGPGLRDGIADDAADETGQAALDHRRACLQCEHAAEKE